MLSGMSGQQTVEWGAQLMASAIVIARRPGRSGGLSPEAARGEARVAFGELHGRMHRALFARRPTAGR